MFVRWEIVDLQFYDDCWIANGCNVERGEFSIPISVTDTQIVRRAKKEMGIQGWRRDDWAGTEFCWRNGTMGAWAEVIHE